jgi:hypothetical protein
MAAADVGVRAQDDVGVEDTALPEPAALADHHVRMEDGPGLGRCRRRRRRTP